MHDKSYVIDFIKTAQISCNSSRRFTIEDLKKSVDYSFPNRRIKANAKDPITGLQGKFVSKKKKDDEMHLIEKYSVDWESPGFRGHPILRMTHLNQKEMKYEDRELFNEKIKEINKLCVNIGISFPRKTPPEVYTGIFCRIYDSYLSILGEETPQTLKSALEPEFGEHFTLSISQENFDRIKDLIEFVYQNLIFIFDAQVDFGDGFKEIDFGFKNLTSEMFDHIHYPIMDLVSIEKSKRMQIVMAEGKNLDKEVTDPFENFNFDILDIDNEYLTFEKIDESTTIVTRGQNLSKKAKVEEQAAKKVSTAIAELGTEEDVKRLQEDLQKDFIVMDKKANQEVMKEVNQSKAKMQHQTSRFKEFFETYQKELTENAFWQMNLQEILEKLTDVSKTNDMLFDPLFNMLNYNMEMVTFLLEHRQEIIIDYQRTRKDIEKSEKDKRKKGLKQKISKNLGTEIDALENDSVMNMLGMNEEKKKKSNLAELEDEEELDADEIEILDYVNIMADDMKKSLGSGTKRQEFPEYIMIDVVPQERIEVKSQDDLFPIASLPEYLQTAFGNLKYLNQLQTKVKETCFDTDENVLICAPTGAGKTNVAMLCILREINKTFDFRTKKAGDFKIVYISPLKALATEIVEKFDDKLKSLGVVVKEYTGDMGLTRQELQETHIIVATPEKWDVMTRKSSAIADMVTLIIIDEIHLLDEERGRVLECIVARTLMLAERNQKLIRLAGLSATLPNYVDVAKFMKVKKGLYYFSEAYRPVPLHKKFIGCRRPKANVKQTGGRDNDKDKKKQQKDNQKTIRTEKDVMNEVCYDFVKENLINGEQVLVFVHSRRETYELAKYLLYQAQIKDDFDLFRPGKDTPEVRQGMLINNDLKKLVGKGLGSHNAGLARRDRRTIEQAFLAGSLRVVVCTATLAWGVNLPAHTVIIKGTDIYEPGVGWKDLSILDVQQIFGRAGRPQFDSYGEAILITSLERLNHFVGLMNSKLPINSNFESCLMEAVNAEIALGNISTSLEAYDYIKRTFFYVRAKKQPALLGLKRKHEVDSSIIEMLEKNLLDLHKLRLLRYDHGFSELVESTDLGRIASHYYINCGTMERFCTYLNFYEDDSEGQAAAANVNIDNAGDIEDQNLLAILAQASEFKQLQVRPDEFMELKKLKRVQFLEPVHQNFLKMIDTKKEKDSNNKRVGGNTEDDDDDAGNVIDPYAKVMLLIQGYLSMADYDTYSLVADTNYIIQNGTRILRCIFEICLRKNLAYLSITVLRWCRYIENCIRDDLTPLRMFCFENVKRGILNLRKGDTIKKTSQFVEEITCRKVEDYIENMPEGQMGHMNAIKSLRAETDLSYRLRLSKQEETKLNRALKYFPIIEVEYTLRPVAQTILKVDVVVTPDFLYSKQFHMGKENFWVIVDDGQGEILHYEEFGISTKNLEYGKRIIPVELSFYLPFKGGKRDYVMTILSERFVGVDKEIEIDLSNVMVHSEKTEYTDLLNLRPLPISTLHNKDFEGLFTHIKYFNPVQTQVFFALYHTDHNSIVGSPTGSGKTIICELAILRVFQNTPQKKIVYVAPYKALAKERLKDWTKRLGAIGKSVIELTGDFTPDLQALVSADVLVTTPEKWDGVSRNWQQRNYVQEVGLIIFDEIHLLGQERGPVIEVIVSRMGYIGKKTNSKIRMIGLSTAMANGADVANWFGVPQGFLFNFRPNVRPVPVEIHFKGFTDKNYCPRMNSMNKPAFNDIQKFSPHSPVLIFVSSRRQTRLTALDLIQLSMNKFGGTSPYLRMDHMELSNALSLTQDSYLKQTLEFGIGMHHAGLVSSDRRLVEDLFVQNKIQILVATSTLAWGVNFPAKLVIIKGTEYFDPNQKNYVDMPISDILQMVGRAGRPQYNDKGFACVYVEKSKKNFYRKYLNDPFPIESCIADSLPEHINAEIVSGTITNKQNAMDYLTWTYYFRRITKNPLFYNIEKPDHDSIQKFLMGLIDKVVVQLKENNCVTCDDGFNLIPTFTGHTASFYYIQPKTIFQYEQQIKPNQGIYELLKIISHSEEYSTVPVRHNEDTMNEALANICPYPVDRSRLDSPKTKTLLLLQAYFSSLPLPIRDYVTDTTTVLENVVRFIQALIDIAAEKGYLNTLLNLTQLCQMVTQGCWIDESSFLNLPGIQDEDVDKLKKAGVTHLCQLIEIHNSGGLKGLLDKAKISMPPEELYSLKDVIKRIPDVYIDVKMHRFNSEKMEPELNNTGRSLRIEDEIFVSVNGVRENWRFPLKVAMQKQTRPKDCSWWLIVGDEEKNTVLTVKKVGVKKQFKKEFQLSLPRQERCKKISFYFVNDSYFGLDQVITYDLDQYSTPEPGYKPPKSINPLKQHYEVKLLTNQDQVN